MANNNPYPNLDNIILDMVSIDNRIKTSDIIRAVSIPESTIRAHLRKLCREKKLKQVRPLKDMRSVYYKKGDCV